METWPGKPYPLGANWDGQGVNFALFSENATGVDLCLFIGEEETCVPVEENTNHVWHIYIPGLKPGQCYGYRVKGLYEPQKGLRFNHNKLLFDPYAKAIDGSVTWNDSLFGYKVGDPKADLSFSETNSAPYMPKCAVIDPSFDWEGDVRLNIPLHETIIYELHVKGFTQQHPDVPENLRGTYSGLATQPVIDYLKNLGVTAVELLPVHQFISDRGLVDKKLTNYWGYNSIGYFAPDARYASGGTMGEQVSEFKNMVKTLHKAGIEVILDVVYNHTAEGNQLGPTLSFRGIDNSAYYRLVADNARYYTDYTGTGNTLNMTNPSVLQLLMDSLRYWVQEMHVDGFRFDLASTLARELHDVDRLGSFFDVIHQDPVISQVKLIAEPWDVGEGGYQVGNFPPGWAEWNGKYRDTVRDFWRGAESTLAELASRLTGSSDLYGDDGRQPTASINFITAHDGFTLNDLVSYNDKHNEDNGENNKDGESHNRSWNCGAEGSNDDPAINALRNQQKRNFLATLFMSQGVPMIVAGDEMGRTQGGNNNAYCQDNEISWVNWSAVDEDLLDYTRQLITLVKEHPVFRQRRWFKGRQLHGGTEDIGWFEPSGEEMSEESWRNGLAKSLGVFLYGKGIHAPDEHGQKIVDNSFYLMFNAHHEPMTFTIPTADAIKSWRTVLSTAQLVKAGEEGQPVPEILPVTGGEGANEETLAPGQDILVDGRSLVVLQSV